MHNDQWILICTAMVFFMQAGFLALECGLVRKKNRGNVTIKNCLDFCVSGIVFLIVGYGLMFGNSFQGLIGSSNFFVVNDGDYAFFIFQLVFCSTAITIASGAIAERIRFHNYILLVFVATIFIYPISGHWIWATDFTGASTGFLGKMGFLDFAGGTVVHSVGAWIALATLLILGPREGRFDPSRKQEFETINAPLIGMGVLILWVGWMGFNGGSELAFTQKTPQIITNTIIAGMVGGLTILGSEILLKEKVRIDQTLNGVLAGLVAITASCAWVSSSSAIVIAIVGAIVSKLSMNLLIKCKIDDVVSAVSIHGVAGVWGTLSVALFADSSIFETGTSRFEQFGFQLVGVMVVFIWGFGLTFLVIKIVNSISPLRVSKEEEEAGLDWVEHGQNSISAESEPSKEPSRSPLVLAITTYKPSDSRGIQILFERSVIIAVVVGLLVGIGLLSTAYRAFYNFAQREKENALATHAELIKEIRQIYTEKVVDRAKGRVTASHDYQVRDGEIPLPATLTKELSKRFKDSEKINTLLYSDFPFPWGEQANRKILEDPYRTMTLSNLRKNPKVPVIEVVDINGGKMMRYSVADVLGESCVGCHNSHPDTPKSSWVVGDVIGVLELQTPYSVSLTDIRRRSRGSLFGIFVLLMVAGITLLLLLKRFKRISLTSQSALTSIQEEQLKFKSVTDATSDGIISFSFSGEIVFFNNAINEITGYKPSELKGSDISNIFSEEILAPIRARSISPVFEFGLQRKTGEIIMTEISISNWEANHQIFFSAIIRDMTEKKFAEKKLRDQEAVLIQKERFASIGELAAGVGHEINNPLAILSGTIDTIDCKTMNESERRKISTIKSAIHRIAKIVDSLRTFSRVDKVEVRVLDLNEIVRDTANLVETIYLKEGVEFKLELEATTSSFKGNLGKIQQVLMNLVSNARDATAGQDERKIIVRTKNTQENVILEVVDNGCGISELDKSKIFDAFFTTKSQGAGTGLGLSLVRKFLDEIDGVISIDSVVDQGSTVIVVLPLNSEESFQGRNVAALKADDSILTGRLLIVDDEPDILLLLQMMLRNTKLEIVLSDNGADAWEKLQATKFDYLITDVQMPRLSGLELISRICKDPQFKSMKKFILTGGITIGLSAEQRSQLEANVDGMIPKPFDQQTIIQLLSGDTEQEI